MLVFLCMHFLHFDHKEAHIIYGAEFVFQNVHENNSWRFDKRSFDIDTKEMPIYGHATTIGHAVIIKLRTKKDFLKMPWLYHRRMDYECITVSIPSYKSGTNSFDIANENIVVYYSSGSYSHPLRNACAGYGTSGSLSIQSLNDGNVMFKMDATIVAKRSKYPGSSEPSELCHIDPIRNVTYGGVITKENNDWKPPWEMTEIWKSVQVQKLTDTGFPG